MRFSLPARLGPALLLLGALGSAQDELAHDLAELERLTDSAPVESVQRVAAVATPEAVAALLALYPRMYSAYMRREILRALAQLAGDEELGPSIRAHLVMVAGGSPAPELRTAALDAIDGLEAWRAALFVSLVESEVILDTRVEALRRHALRATAEDLDWYRGLVGSHEPARRGDDAGQGPPALRELAFDGLRSSLEPRELERACEDPQASIRRLALEELVERGDKRGVAVAERIFESASEPTELRLAAAHALLRLRGPKVAKSLATDATRGNLPKELSFGVAELLAELGDPGLDKWLVRRLSARSKVREAEWMFSLRAASRLDDPRVNKALLASLEHESPSVVALAIRIIGERRDVEALEPLAAVLAQGDPVRAAEAAVAMARIRGEAPQAVEELVELAGHPLLEVRNGALQRLARDPDPEHLELFLTALEDPQWSTRLIAAHALEHLRDPRGVGALCRRIAHEKGRPAHEMAAILWRLTGQPFGRRNEVWALWWADVGEDFEVIEPEELARLEREAEDRRLKRVTRALFEESAASVFIDDPDVFFGLRVISERIAFVVDISLSMEEPLAERGSEGGPATRIDLARQELCKILRGLDPGARFDLITFSGDAQRWGDGVQQASPENVERAVAYLDELDLGFWTNLYDALLMAFEDEEVDTIYLITDGEPAGGVVNDPWAIRRRVRDWNRHRGVVIHSISVGLDFPLPRWLAEDAGGSHESFR